MHIALSDLLTCPRCGPEFGLVLLADRVEARRVLEGWYGCANCRDRYRVAGGVADLRREAGEPADERADRGLERLVPDGDGAAAMRLAALVGITEGPAYVLVLGPASSHAGALARIVPKLEVVTFEAGAAEWTEEDGVSRLLCDGALPLFGRSLRGVVLTGAWARAGLEEGARVVGPLGRLVVEGGDDDVLERVARAGLAVLAAEGVTVVAVRK